ncbi:hypothetical protein NEDG_00751 [Nematocida displodere]|uniref:Uncharacterized protein n=1 Tax=Nematocida displodere TaxID=1805483 RepID=A0A177ECS0_9MICR|nr:hypothetical protein NEDG_00751 [Nematocida displodere]
MRSGGEHRSESEKEFCHQYKQTRKEFVKKPTEELAAKLLRINSEECLAYDFLKETLELATFKKQLSLSEELLTRHPKTYTGWYHRRFIMGMPGAPLEERPKPKPKPEPENEKQPHEPSPKEKDLSFVASLLGKDSRNYFCWTYVNKVHGSPKDFCAKQLAQSPHNYSAYHSLFQAGTYQELKDRDVEEMGGAGQDTLGLWLFWQSKEELQRFNQTNVYAKVFADRISFIFREATTARIAISLKEAGSKALEYQEDYKKTATLFFSQEKFQFSEIESITIQMKKATEEINLAQEYTPTQPEFLTKALKTAKHPAALFLLLNYLDQKGKKHVITELMNIDPQRKGMYLEMQEYFLVFRAGQPEPTPPPKDPAKDGDTDPAKDGDTDPAKDGDTDQAGAGTPQIIPNQATPESGTSPEPE